MTPCQTSAVGVFVAYFSLFCASLGVAQPKDPSVLKGDAKIHSTALFLVPPDGWAEVEERATRLTKMHALVLGVEVGSNDCGLSDALFDQVTKAQLGADVDPMAPVIIGVDAAAGVAYQMAAARPNSVKGLVTISENPTPPCHQGETGKAPVRWHIVTEPERRNFGDARSGTRRYEPSETNPDPLVPAYLSLAGMDHAYDPRTKEALIPDLPLTVHPAPPEAPARDGYAIFLSGDGGWARFDEEISDFLAAAGLPVVGISSLKYLWVEKSPEEIASDIARLDAAAQQRFGRDRVVLIGFSMGASVMPFAMAHLPDDLADRLDGVVLLSPERRTGFEIVIGGWLGRETGSADVVEALDQLSDAAPILCLHGEQDSASACPLSDVPLRLTLPGGHHMGSVHEEIARHIDTFLNQAEEAELRLLRQPMPTTQQLSR